MTSPADPATSFSEPADRLARWLLQGPLAVGLLGLGLVHLATWLPHYLTWPFWADHDVFATMAQGWSRGRLPYRDVLGNNFPGTIYLFWVLGKLCGWGRTLPFFAVDAGFVVVFCAALLIWSLRRFQRLLPGSVAALAFLSYYLGLDYSTAAQRDWQGPFFVLLGILAAESWPGRTTRILSAMLAALAFSFRPQTVLFLPSLFLAVVREPRVRPLRAALEWSLAMGVSLVLAFSPLVAAGVAADFVRGVRTAAFGGYNTVSARSFLVEFARQTSLRDLAVLAAVLFLIPRAGEATRRTAWNWVAAFVFVSLYKPLSPYPHAYLDHPMAVVAAVNLGVLTALVLEARSVPPSLRVTAVLLAVGMGVVLKPTFANPSTARAALALIREEEVPAVAPMGYRHNPAVLLSAVYPWDDYRALLEYLRRETSPTSRVANALQGVPALTGPSGRLSAFPAESIAWLFMVKRDDEGAFAELLEATPDSVVVWAPGEIGYNPKYGRSFELERIEPVIRRLYEPSKSFGAIEVWRRKAEAGGPP